MRSTRPQETQLGAGHKPVISRGLRLCTAWRFIFLAPRAFIYIECELCTRDV